MHQVETVRLISRGLLLSLASVTAVLACSALGCQGERSLVIDRVH